MSKETIYPPLIMTSYEHENFKKIIGNRPIMEGKVNKLIEDIKNGLNLLKYCPILVYEKNGQKFVIEGQHRLEACRRLKHVVYYVVCSELKLQDIARLNSRTDKWKTNDFLQCYVKIGSKHYTFLQEFVKKYDFNVNTVAALLMRGKISDRTEVSEAFKEGKFVVLYQKETARLLEKVNYLFPKHRHRKDRNLITAVQLIESKNLVDWQKLRAKIIQTEELEKQATVKDYLREIEKIYNFKAKERKIIF